MICCEKCFNSDVLKTLIISFKNKGNCDFCSSKGVNVYDMDTNNGLDDKFNELLSCFSKSELLIENNYPKYDLFALKTELKDKWNIFNFPNDSDVYRFLESLLKNKFPDKLELLDGQVGIIEIINPNYLQKNSIFKGKNWNDFLKHIKHELRFHSNFVNYDILKYFLSLLTVNINDVDYYRARICNEYTLEAKDMGAPPSYLATAGRANSEGISHLYLGNEPNTVIGEIRPNISDDVYIGRFPIRNKLKIIDFRKLNSVDVFDMQEVAKFAVNIDILNNMNSAISKPVRSGDSKLDYLPTQFIVDYIKSLGLQKEEKYDGIIFDSTISNGNGYNLMIFDPDILDCNNVEKRNIDSLIYNTST